MKVITLLTDFGLKDNFVGVMKGVILSINPKVHIVDITHSITSHNVREGAFMLYRSYRYFPKGTIFLVVVDPGVGSERKPIALETKRYCFVGPDNGVLSMAAKEDGVEKIVTLENKRYFLKYISSTFHGRDIFSPVAAYIAKGVNISSLGARLKTIKEITLPSPIIEKERLKVELIYHDKFGNLVTNLKKDTLLGFLKGKGFIATLKGRKIYKIYDCYAEAKNNEPFFIEGSSSFLEISLKNKNAAGYFSLNRDEKAQILIKSKEE